MIRLRDLTERFDCAKVINNNNYLEFLLTFIRSAKEPQINAAVMIAKVN